MSGEEHGEARQYSFKSNQIGSSWGKVVHVRLETDELVVQFPDRVEEHLPLTSIRGLRLRRPTGSVPVTFRAVSIDAVPAGQLLNGQAVEVTTQIDVNFTLSE